jgi:hypothetical protein
MTAADRAPAPASWIGKRLVSMPPRAGAAAQIENAPRAGAAAAGAGGEIAGTVVTQRQGRGERYVLGVRLDAGGFAFVAVDGPPPPMRAGGDEIRASIIAPPPLGAPEARELAEAVLNGRAQRAPLENVERALAAAVLAFVAAAP